MQLQVVVASGDLVRKANNIPYSEAMNFLQHSGGALVVVMSLLAASNAAFNPCLYDPKEKIPLLKPSFTGSWYITEWTGSGISTFTEILLGDRSSDADLTCPAVNFGSLPDLRENTTLSAQVNSDSGADSAQSSINSNFVNNFFFGRYYNLQSAEENLISYQVIGTDYDNWGVIVLCIPEINEGGAWVVSRTSQEDGFNDKKLKAALKNVGLARSDFTDTVQTCD